ncbi:hypothetical protein P8452_22383 [Trifolium repens]|nr:hypothetical protein P8452_22383 [Trifolium repens]
MDPRVPVAVRGDTAVLGDGGDRASFSFFLLLQSVTFFTSAVLLQQTSNLKKGTPYLMEMIYTRCDAHDYQCIQLGIELSVASLHCISSNDYKVKKEEN